VLFISQFGAARFLIPKRKVIVAMNTGEVAAPGDLDGSADGHSARNHALVNAAAPVFIAMGFHRSTG